MDGLVDTPWRPVTAVARTCPCVERVSAGNYSDPFDRSTEAASPE